MQFYVVYIREAHALDSRQPAGGGSNPIVEDPTSLHERRELARTCSAKIDLGDLPVLVDGVEDAVNTAYAAWPDRIYLVGRDGLIAYQGGRGPFGFLPDELEVAIQAELARAPGS